MKELLSIAAPFVAIASTVPYIIDIIKGHTKPNVVTWFTWTVLLVIATAAAFTAHETRTALLSLGDLFGTALVLILGIKFGIAKLSLFDLACQIGAIAGLVLWLVFDSPLIAIIAVVVIDFIASLPTVRHSWLKPSEETWQSYFVMLMAACLTVLSLKDFSGVSLGFPLYLIIIDGVLVCTIIFRRRSLGLNVWRPGKNEAPH